MKLEFEVRQQEAKVLGGNNELVAESRNYVFAHFTFTNDWRELTKTIFFKQGESTFITLVLDQNDCCLVPKELLANDGDFTIHVTGSGIDGTIITTNPLKVFVKGNGIITNDNTGAPTVDFLTESVAEVKRCRDDVETMTGDMNERMDDFAEVFDKVEVDLQVAADTLGEVKEQLKDCQELVERGDQIVEEVQIETAKSATNALTAANAATNATISAGRAEAAGATAAASAATAAGAAQTATNEASKALAAATTAANSATTAATATQTATSEADRAKTEADRAAREAGKVDMTNYYDMPATDALLANKAQLNSSNTFTALNRFSAHLAVSNGTTAGSSGTIFFGIAPTNETVQATVGTDNVGGLFYRSSAREPHIFRIGNNNNVFAIRDDDTKVTFSSDNNPFAIVTHDGVAKWLGNARTATKLETARTINGVAFDGKKDITVEAGGIVDSLLAQNGYVKFANGLILQWGNSNEAKTDTTVTFPIAFSVLYSVVGVPKSSGNLSGSNSNFGIKSQGIESFIANMYDIGNGYAGFNWFAIGRQ